MEGVSWCDKQTQDQQQKKNLDLNVWNTAVINHQVCVYVQQRRGQTERSRPAALSKRRSERRGHTTRRWGPARPENTPQVQCQAPLPGGRGQLQVLTPRPCCSAPRNTLLSFPEAGGGVVTLGGGACCAGSAGARRGMEESSLGMTCVTIITPPTVVTDVDAMMRDQREFWENKNWDMRNRTRTSRPGQTLPDWPPRSWPLTCWDL